MTKVIKESTVFTEIATTPYLSLIPEPDNRDVMAPWFIRGSDIEFKYDGFHVRGKSGIWVNNELIMSTPKTIIIRSASVAFLRSNKKGPLYNRVRKYYTHNIFSHNGVEIYYQNDLIAYPEWFNLIESYDDIYQHPHNKLAWEHLGIRSEPKYVGKHVFITANNKLYLTANGKKWVIRNPENVQGLVDKYPQVVAEFNSKINVTHGCMIMK